MDGSALLGIIFGGFGFIALIAGGAGYYKGATAKAYIASLREANQDLRNDVNDADRRAELCAEQRDQFKRRAEVLEKVVTAKHELGQLLAICNSILKEVRKP